jgi:CheY-like chemotaxis protein
MNQQSNTIKILVIDDDEIFLSLIEEILTEKYEVIKATSGKEALEHLLKGAVPDLIMLDIIMPEMDGWETFNKIKGISLLKDVPIVFMTSLEEADSAKHANELGAADFLKKPFKREELLNRIETLLSKSYGLN